MYMYFSLNFQASDRVHVPTSPMTELMQQLASLDNVGGCFIFSSVMYNSKTIFHRLALEKVGLVLNLSSVCLSHSSVSLRYTFVRVEVEFRIFSTYMATARNLDDMHCCL